MKHALAFAASVAAGALAVGVAPAAADLPVAGNSANDSIGTVQVGPTVAGAAAVVTTQDATAAAVVVVPTMGDAGNTADHSIGTVQSGGGNDARRSAGTVQVGGGNGATPGGGSGGGGTSGGGASGSGEHSLASAAQSGGVNPVTQKAPRAAPAKNNTTAFRPPASRPSATRQIQGTVARPTSSVQGSSLPFTGLTLASFLGGALALALLGSLLRRAALPVR